MPEGHESIVIHCASMVTAEGTPIRETRRFTPGNSDIPMGELEKDETGTYLKFNAYLTGTDIICDGGCIASGAGVFDRLK